MFNINNNHSINAEIYLSENISFVQVIDKDRIIIERNLKKLFPVQMPIGKISLLSGGKSDDNLYIFAIHTKILIIRIVPETHLNDCLKQLSYSEMAAQKQIGPHVIYQNLNDGLFITEFIEGTALSSNYLDNDTILLQLSRCLRTIHHSKNVSKDEYNIFNHIKFNLKKLTQSHVHLLSLIHI